MKKKILSWLLTCAILLSMVPAAWAADSKFSFELTADQTTVEAGDTITYTVTATATVPCCSIYAEVTIPEGLTYVAGSGQVDTQLATTTKADGDVSFTEASDGTLLMIMCARSEPLDGLTNIVMATFQCVVDDAAAGKLSVELENVEITDENIDIISNDYVAVTPAEVHIHTTELRNAKAATCAEEGYTGDQVCTICDEVVTKGEVIAKTEHTTELQNAKAATCTEEGYTGDWVCTICDEVVTKGEVIAKTEHTTELQNVKEATCTEEGYTGDYVCTVCNQTITTGQTIAKVEHTWNEGEITKEPSCTEEGVKTYTCTVCGDEKTEAIDKIAHTTATLNAKAATCTEEGMTGSEVCTVCGAVVKANEVIPALGHKTATDGYVAPTCTESGWTGTGVCEVCRETVYENAVIPATGHQKEEIPAVEATCTEAGATAGEKCSVCGEILTKPETIPAKGHTTVEIPAVAATCTEAGATAGEKCSVCGEILTKPGTISAKGHTTVEIPAVAATCTEAGATAGEKCSVCGEILKQPETIPATGHSWDDGKVTKEPTLTSEGEMTYTCTVCEATKTEKIDKLTECDGGADCPSHGYSDIDTSKWYHKDVDYVIKAGLMVGYGGGSFGPEATLTRAELVKILYNRAGQPAVSGTPKFSDVPSNEWYAKAVIWATENEVTFGYGDGKFGPDDPVTREQIATMLYRDAGEPATNGSLSKFPDGNTASEWALPALKWAVEIGVLQGDDLGTLRPTASASRAEIAAMLHRYMEG